MEAVARKLVRRDIIPDVAGLYAPDQQVSDELPKLAAELSFILVVLMGRHVLVAEFVGASIMVAILVFLFRALAAVLVWRFTATGGAGMLRMMNCPTGGAHAHHHGH